MKIHPEVLRAHGSKQKHISNCFVLLHTNNHCFFIMPERGNSNKQVITPESLKTWPSFECFGIHKESGLVQPEQGVEQIVNWLF